MVFALGMAFLAVMEFANFLTVSAYAEQTIILWKKVGLSGEVMAAGTWLLFGVIYAKEDPKSVLKKWCWILLLAYLLPCILLFFIFSTIQMSWTEGLEVIRLGQLGRYFHVLLLVVIIMALVNLEYTFRSLS
jgi:hypothetical protein